MAVKQRPHYWLLLRGKLLCDYCHEEWDPSTEWLAVCPATAAGDLRQPSSMPDIAVVTPARDLIHAALKAADAAGACNLSPCAFGVWDKCSVQCASLQAAVDAARKEGYDGGYEKGHEAGYDKGYDDGVEDA